MTRVSMIRKDEFEFHTRLSELEIHVWDYHADPIHLTLEELSQLGLETTGERGGLPESTVASWRRNISQGRGRDIPTPQLSDEANVRALHTGGVALVPVAEGLDVYVLSYHAMPVRLEEAHLLRLGLRHRSA